MNKPTQDGCYVYDDKSPPGSWKSEMEKAPWAFGQAQNVKVDNALANVRMRGLWSEASILSAEITTLKAELESVRGQLDEAKRHR